MRKVPPISRSIAGLLFAAGILSAGLSAYYAGSRPEQAAATPEDAALRTQLASLRDATPESLAQLAAQASAQRIRLPSSKNFDAWLRDWSVNWVALARSIDRYPDLEVRHYALAYRHPQLRDWSDIVRAVGMLCGEPGLTIDALSLSAAPDEGDAFVEAQITLTARLRP